MGDSSRLLMLAKNTLSKVDVKNFRVSGFGRQSAGTLKTSLWGNAEVRWHITFPLPRSDV